MDQIDPDPYIMPQNEFIAVNCIVAFVSVAAVALEVRHLPFKSNWSIGCNIMACLAQVLTAVFWTQSVLKTNVAKTTFPNDISRILSSRLCIRTKRYYSKHILEFQRVWLPKS